MNLRNVIIIGSGPSGYTAALYAARANLEPLLIAGSLDPKTSRIKGGQLMYTSDIENFPGAISDPNATVDEVTGVSGPDLMHRMELQARHFGTEMIEEFVTEVDVCSHPGRYSIVRTAAGRNTMPALSSSPPAPLQKRMGISCRREVLWPRRRRLNLRYLRWALLSAQDRGRGGRRRFGHGGSLVPFETGRPRAPHPSS